MQACNTCTHLPDTPTHTHDQSGLFLTITPLNLSCRCRSCCSLLPSSSSPQPPLRPHDLMRPPLHAPTPREHHTLAVTRADVAAPIVVVATTTTMTSTLDANHAAYVASAGTRRPSSSSSATHAELLLHRRHTPSSTAQADTRPDDLAAPPPTPSSRRPPPACLRRWE